MSLHTRLIALAAIILFGDSAVAQQNRSNSAQSQNSTPSGQSQSYSKGAETLAQMERKFLTQSAQDSQLEFVMAQIAVQKATNPQIVQAQRLIENISAKLLGQTLKT